MDKTASAVSFLYKSKFKLFSKPREIRLSIVGTLIATTHQVEPDCCLGPSMRYLFVKSFAVAATTVLLSGGANAAIVTNTYTVIGSNFSSTAPSPYASITESFTVTFDTATNVSQGTTISLNAASTIIPTSSLAFTYIAVANRLIVGGIAATVTTPDPTSTDFAVIIQNASNTANFSITTLSYTVGTGATFTATTSKVGTPPTSVVPEPASLALLATAGATLAAMRRRRTNV